MYVSKCQYWDEKQFVWSSDGCEVKQLSFFFLFNMKNADIYLCCCSQLGWTIVNIKSTECLCTHLTTFGSDFYVPPNTIDFSTVFLKFKNLNENAAVFSTVMVIFGIYVIAAIWARRKDKQDLIKVDYILF